MDESISTIATALLARVKSGETDAWRRFVELYEPWVYHWCRNKYKLQPADAEDVGQAVFVAIFGKVSDFRRDGSGHSFRAWLRTITRNKVIDFWKKSEDNAYGGSSQEFVERCLEPEDKAEVAAEIGMWFQKTLEMIRQSFSEKDYLAFVKYVVENNNAAAVAEELEITRNQVYLAKARILAWLRKNLGEDIDGVFSDIN